MRNCYPSSTLEAVWCSREGKTHTNIIECVPGIELRTWTADFSWSFRAMGREGINYSDGMQNSVHRFKEIALDKDRTSNTDACVHHLRAVWPWPSNFTLLILNILSFKRQGAKPFNFTLTRGQAPHWAHYLMSLNYQHHPMKEVLFLTSFTDKNFRCREVNWFAQGHTLVGWQGQVRLTPKSVFFLTHAAWGWAQKRFISYCIPS